MKTIPWCHPTLERTLQGTSGLFQAFVRLIARRAYNRGFTWALQRELAAELGCSVRSIGAFVRIAEERSLVFCCDVGPWDPLEPKGNRKCYVPAEVQGDGSLGPPSWFEKGLACLKELRISLRNRALEAIEANRQKLAGLREKLHLSRNSKRNRRAGGSKPPGSDRRQTPGGAAAPVSFYEMEFEAVRQSRSHRDSVWRALKASAKGVPGAVLWLETASRKWGMTREEIADAF